MTNFDFPINEMKPCDVVMTSTNSFLWMDSDNKMHYSNVKPDTLDSECVWTFESNVHSAGMHGHWLYPIPTNLTDKTVYRFVRKLGVAHTPAEADKVVSQFIEVVPETSFFEIGVLLLQLTKASAK